MPEEVSGFERESSLQQYVLLGEHLAKGGQGSVYRYVHPRTGSVYAAKVLFYDEQTVSTDGEAGNIIQILKEQYAAPHFKHEHLIKAHAVFEYPNGWVIIMPYYRQGSLSRVHFQPHQVKNAIRQILEALRHLHELGCIHRDIKPSNILVRNGPDEPLDLVVADYGLISLQEPVTACGTKGFTAPEVLRNYGILPEKKLLYQNAADIYSLGILILRLLRIAVPPIDIQTRHDHNKHIKPLLYEELEACEGSDVERQDLLTIAQTMLHFNPKNRPSAHHCLQLTELVPTTAAPSVTGNVRMIDSSSQGLVGPPAVDWWNSNPKSAADEQRSAKKQSRNGRKIPRGGYGLRKRSPKQYGPGYTRQNNKVKKNQASSLLTPRATPKRNFDALKTREESQSPGFPKQTALSKSWDKMEISDQPALMETKPGATAVKDTFSHR